MTSVKITDKADLRRQAERALRLARGIFDEQAARALNAHAASLFEQADSLEQQDISLPVPSAEQYRPAQQQQQIQPKDEDKKK